MTFLLLSRLVNSSLHSSQFTLQILVLQLKFIPFKLRDLLGPSVNY